MLGTEIDYNKMFLPIAKIMKKHNIPIKINKPQIYDFSYLFFLHDLLEYLSSFGGYNDIKLNKKEFINILVSQKTEKGSKNKYHEKT